MRGQDRVEQDVTVLTKLGEKVCIQKASAHSVGNITVMRRHRNHSVKCCNSTTKSSVLKVLCGPAVANGAGSVRRSAVWITCSALRRAPEKNRVYFKPPTCFKLFIAFVSAAAGDLSNLLCVNNTSDDATSAEHRHDCVTQDVLNTLQTIRGRKWLRNVSNSGIKHTRCWTFESYYLRIN
jgi:hypothetical protein